MGPAFPCCKGQLYDIDVSKAIPRSTTPAAPAVAPEVTLDAATYYQQVWSTSLDSVLLVGFSPQFV